MKTAARSLLVFLVSCSSLVALHVDAQRLVTEGYYFTTLAGASSTGSADGASDAARFFHPQGLASDATGNVYVADTLNHTLRKISPLGGVITLAGNPGVPGTTDGTGSAAFFNLPKALVLHTDGNLYVGETGGIRRVTREGVVTRFASPAIFASSVVLALLSEPGGTLVAADQSTIVRFTATETPILFRNSDLWMNAQFAALARDASGTIFIAMNGVIPDSSSPGSFRNQARIYRVLTSGSWGIFADETNGLAGVGHLNALTVDAQNSVYAAGSSGAIYRFSGGNMTVYAGMPGAIGARDGPALQALFSNLFGLTFATSGDLYVAEYNNTIRRVTPAGVVSTLAGLPEEDSARYWDARGTAARFDLPAAIAVASNGVAYVADELNHVIRRIATDGTVTTLAGSPGQAGYADGPATQARFNLPHDLALDSAGNLYVIENSGAVRKVTLAGDVSTLAGAAAYGTVPAQNGQGADARFGVLSAIAVSPSDEIYVAESQAYSATIGQVWARLRKITPAGVVSTLQVPTVNPHSYFSGIAIDRDGVIYLADPTYLSLHRLPPQGAADTLRFSDLAPRRVATSANGNLFLTEGEFGAARVARAKPAAGEFEWLGGGRYAEGHRDGVGANARFTELTGIAVDAAGAIYLTDENNTVRKGVPSSPPSITTPPSDRAASAGAVVTLTVSAAGMPEPTYQWYFNGVAIAGATASSYTIASVNSSNAGSYHVIAANERGTATSSAATLTVTAASAAGNNGGGSSGASGGGGGGAPSDFFFAACAALALGRAWRRQRASGRGE